MRPALRFMSLLTLAFLLSACATSGLLTTNDPAQGVFVYGYFDMSKAGREAKHVVVGSNQNMPIGTRWGLYKLNEKGHFAVRNLEPSYVYRVKGIMGVSETYNFGPDLDEGFILKPSPGDMIYVGAYRYVPHQRTGRDVLSNSGSFSLEPARDMSETEVLRMVRDSVRDEHWARRIDERLGQLARR